MHDKSPSRNKPDQLELSQKGRMNATAKYLNNIVNCLKSCKRTNIHLNIWSSDYERHALINAVYIY